MKDPNNILPERPVELMGIKRAHSIRTFACANPACHGVHIIPCDNDDEPLCEIVLSVEILLSMAAVYTEFEGRA